MIPNNATEEQIKEIYLLANLSTEDINLIENYTPEVEKIVKVARITAGTAQGIQRRMDTIRKSVKPKDYKRILKENSDILNEDLSIKETAYKFKENGKTIYRTNKEIEALLERINEIKKAAKNGVYDSDANFNRYIKLKKAELSFENKLSDAIKKVTTKKSGNVKYIPITFQDIDGESTIHVKSGREVPKLLKYIISKGMVKEVKTEVQNISEADATHYTITYKKLLDDNYAYLSTISEDEAIDFINFYLDSALLVSDNRESIIALEVQRILASYFLGEFYYNEGRFNFDKELADKLKNRLESVGGIGGTILTNEKLS